MTELMDKPILLQSAHRENNLTIVQKEINIKMIGNSKTYQIPCYSQTQHAQIPAKKNKNFQDLDIYSQDQKTV